MLCYTLTILLTIYLLYAIHCRCEEIPVADLPIVDAAIMYENSSTVTSQQQTSGSGQITEEVIQNALYQQVIFNTPAPECSTQ